MQTKQRSNPLIELISFLTEAGKAFWRKIAAVNELAGCDALEVVRVAQDLGISAADLRALASRDKTAADLLTRRLETLRLDPTSVDPALMRDLQRCCSNCDSKQLCAHELETSQEPQVGRNTVRTRRRLLPSQPSRYIARVTLKRILFPIAISMPSEAATCRGSLCETSALLCLSAVVLCCLQSLLVGTWSRRSRMRGCDISVTRGCRLLVTG